MPAPDTNLPEISVSDLSGAIKRTMEDSFGHVRVRGEISGYRGPHGSGHVYFALKDASAKIEAVIWKGVFGRIKFRPEEGMEVIATGKVSTFAGSSKYQLVIEQMEPAGVGALLAQVEERRRRLAAEGLFDPARKQLLPTLPAVIGVITSPTGAVIRDIIHRLSDRFPRHVIVWPVRVQGETSAAEVTAAIRGFNALDPLGPIPRPDVLIVARGGGSLEDLWGFNDEALVRAAAASDIPLISAVGHETDTTLIDYAADVRAPTPTGAAEIVVPVRSDLLATTRDLAGRLIGATGRALERRRADLRSAARALPSADQLLALPRQRLDTAGARLPKGLKANLDRRRIALAGLAQRLARRSPEAALAASRQRLQGAAARLDAAFMNRVGRARQRLGATGERLGAAFAARMVSARQTIGRDRDRLTNLQQRLRRAEAALRQRRSDRLTAVVRLFGTVNYRAVLARGFALVTDAEGKAVRQVAMAAPGAALSVEVADGRFSVVVDGTGAEHARPAPRAPRSAIKTDTPKAGTPDLFG